MNGVITTEEAQPGTGMQGRISAWLNNRLLVVVVIILAGIIYAQYRPFQQAEKGDRANWDYFAQVVARGGVPYRDVVNIKSPLSAYIGAAAIMVTRPFGVRDVDAIRLVCFAMLLLTAAMTFLVAYEFFGSRRIAFLSSLILIGVNQFGRANVAGIQPKIPMIIFGLITLWAIRKEHPFLAGLSGMLSALIWQPGLLFVGAAGLAFTNYLTRWRDRRLILLIAGAAVPLSIWLIYLWQAGALRDFYLWTIHFNYSVYASVEARSLKDFLGFLKRMLEVPFRQDRVYFVLAVLGFALVVIREIRTAVEHGRRELLRNAPHHSILIAPAVYFVFCIVNVQGAADLFPLVPLMAVFSSVFIIWLVDWNESLLRRARPAYFRQVYAAAVYAIICVLVFTLSVADAFYYRSPRITLEKQDADVREIVGHLEPGDKVFVHGLTELLVLSRLENASRHFFLDRGKDVYLDQVEPGGFEGWFERLRAERPRIVALSRLNRVRRRKVFLDWVARDYVQKKGQVFTYYVRKD